MTKLLSFLLLLMMASSLGFADCATLIKKYEAPDPSSKTMAQIDRWIKRAVTDVAEAEELSKCLVSGAADNPNKVQVAGK